MFVSHHCLNINRCRLAALMAALISSGLQQHGAAQHFDEPSVMNLPYTQLVQDAFFGDYEGTYTSGDGGTDFLTAASMLATAKVYPLGSRRYAVVLRSSAAEAELFFQVELPGRIEGDRLLVSGTSSGTEWEGVISKQTLRILKRGYGGVFAMQSVSRKSPTDGIEPPPGAIVLLPFVPGQKPSLAEWNAGNWVAAPDGVLHRAPGVGPRPDLPRKDIVTKRYFKSVRLHLEFRVPYEPDLRSQARGNSGIFFNDRFEVQVLDSYGVISGTGDCAAIYGVAAPRVNAAFPPLAWQTFDVTYRAPRVDGSGKMTREPTLTVLWNGIKVHADQNVPKATDGSARPIAAAGPIRIQDHGNLVYYRNIWVQELAEED